MAEAYWFGIATFALIGFLVWYYVKQNSSAGMPVRKAFGILIFFGLIVGAA